MTTTCGLIVVLATTAVCLWVVYSGEIWRRVEFIRKGNVRIGELTVCLDPKDEMITQVILDRGCYEPESSAMIREILKPGDTFIDVGANIGWFTLMASRIVGREGRVIAFEPAPESFEYLRRNVEVNGCKNTIIEQKALSNKRGKLELRIHETNKGGHSILTSAERPDSIEVDAISLDEYLEGVEGNLTLVKIDTEGAEGIILQGMQKTLRSQPRMAIIMEFQPTSILRTGVNPTAMLCDLLGMGYEIQVIDVPSGDLVSVSQPQVSKLSELLEASQTHVNILVRHSRGRKREARNARLEIDTSWGCCWSGESANGGVSFAGVQPVSLRLGR
ncbi:MAG: FkbM family methyltransferase [Candidatus Nealsonbacteria bacterium]|nr:FkbM family methyltransferase [Candidatus Nealsonbacteria bacterium]